MVNLLIFLSSFPLMFTRSMIFFYRHHSALKHKLSGTERCFFSCIQMRLLSLSQKNIVEKLNFKQTTKNIKRNLHRAHKHLFPIVRQREIIYLVWFICIWMESDECILSSCVSASPVFGGPACDREPSRHNSFCGFSCEMRRADFMGKWFLISKIKLFHILWWFLLSSTSLERKIYSYFFFSGQETLFSNILTSCEFTFLVEGRKEGEYKQESNKKQTLNGDKTHTRLAIQASCGVRINYDKVIKEVSGGFVTMLRASLKNHTRRRNRPCL